MEDRNMEYHIVPDEEDFLEMYDALQQEMVSIRSELSKVRRAMDINTAMEDHLLSLLSASDSNGRVDIRPLLSSIAEKNHDLRMRADDLTQSLETNKNRSRSVMRRVNQNAL
jgi:hypothetical protein